MPSNIALFDQVRTLPFGSLTASYQTLGIPFGHPVRLIDLINSTDGVLMISFDGVNDYIPILAGAFNLYDVTSDEDHTESFRIAEGTQLYVKYVTAPTKGAIYVVCMYGKGEGS